MKNIIRGVMLTKIKEILNSQELWEEVFKEEEKEGNQDYIAKEVKIVNHKQDENGDISNNESISISLSQV